jgi:hypothetical protein
MSKATLKKVTGVKRTAAQIAASSPATAIASASAASKKVKKPKEATDEPKEQQEPVGVLAQVVQAEMVSGTGDLSQLRDKLLDQTESGVARAQYEQFVRGLDFAPEPSNFSVVTFGDVLQVTPAIKSNKRKLVDLYRVDAAVAQVYTDALSSYKALQDKAEALKISDYARRKKLEQKQLKAQKKPAKIASEIANDDSKGDELTNAASDSTHVEADAVPVPTTAAATETTKTPTATSPAHATTALPTAQ